MLSAVVTGMPQRIIICSGVSLLHIQLATSRAKKGCTAAPDVKQTKTRLHWSPSAGRGCFWRKSVFMWWEKSIKASPNIHSDRIKEKGDNKWCRDDIVIINWVFGGALISKCSTAVKHSLKCLRRLGWWSLATYKFTFPTLHLEQDSGVFRIPFPHMSRCLSVTVYMSLKANLLTLSLSSSGE